MCGGLLIHQATLFALRCAPGRGAFLITKRLYSLRGVHQGTWPMCAGLLIHREVLFASRYAPRRVGHARWLIDIPSGLIRFEVCTGAHGPCATLIACLCEFFLPLLVPLELMGATKKASFTCGWGYMAWLLSQAFLPIVVGFYITHAPVFIKNEHGPKKKWRSPLRP